jgi:DNA-binding transcriptional MerR regulator
MARVRKSFSTSEAAQISGVSHRTVDYWAKTRLIVPSIADANGTGTDRLYDFDDLMALRVAGALRRSGISTQALRSVLGYLREKGYPKGLAGCRLVTVGSDVCLVHNCRELESALKKQGQGIFSFMIDISQAYREVKAQADAIGRAA